MAVKLEHRVFLNPRPQVLDDCGSRFSIPPKTMNTTTSTPTLQPSHAIQAHAGEIWSLVRCSDDYIATGGADGFIRLWKLSETKDHLLRLARVSQASTPHNDVLVLRNNRLGKLLSAGASGGIALWDIDPRAGALRLRQKLGPPKITEEDGYRILETDSGKLVSWGLIGQEPLLWDWSDSADGYRFAGSLPDSQISALAEGSGGRLVCGRTDGRIVIWEMNAGKSLYIPVQGWPAHQGRVRALSISESGMICSAGDDLAIKIWVIGTGARYQLQQTLSGHTSPVADLAETRPGELISSDRGKQVHARWRRKPEFRIWRKRSGGFELLQQHTGIICGYLPDELIVDDLDESVAVWITRKDVYERCTLLLKGQGQIHAAEPLPRGRLVTAGPDGRIALWDIGGLLKESVADHSDKAQFVETGTNDCSLSLRLDLTPGKRRLP